MRHIFELQCPRAQVGGGINGADGDPLRICASSYVSIVYFTCLCLLLVTHQVDLILYISHLFL